MYQGKVVESGDIREVFLHPKHPYTKGLLACRPRLDLRLKSLPTVTDFMEVETDSVGEVIIKEKEPDLSYISPEVVTVDEQKAQII